MGNTKCAVVRECAVSASGYVAQHEAEKDAACKSPHKLEDIPALHVVRLFECGGHVWVKSAVESAD